MKRIALFMIIVISLIFTTGCWDLGEINERIFPYSVGIDVNTNLEEDEEYLITFSYPNIDAMGDDPNSDTKVFIISTKANNIFDGVKKLSDRVDKPIDLKHLKVLAISEEVAKDKKNLLQIVDGLNRDFTINKAVYLLLTKDIEELFEAKLESKRQETIEGLIYTLLRNNQKSTRFTSRTLNEFIESMDKSSSSFIPLAKAVNDEIIISGGAVFKDYSLIGHIDEEENRSINILNKNFSEDELETNYKGTSLALETTNVKVKKRLDNSDGNLNIVYSVELEGQIQEYILDHGKDLDIKGIHEMEDALEDKIKRDLQDTVYKIQNELKADIIGIGDYIYKYHPKIWRDIKKDWEDIFPQMDIDVNVEVKIRRRGLVGK